MTSILCSTGVGTVAVASSRALSWLNSNPRSPISRSFKTLARPLRRSSSLLVSAMENASAAGGSIASFSAQPAGAGGDARRFALSSSSCLVVQKGDITKWFVDGASDAIVNPANERMLGGGGADGAIHRAAGSGLLTACRKVPEVQPGVRCPTGEARITPGFELPASHVIHTVGPIYNSDRNPKASLGSAYRNSLKIAIENKIQYIAFPAISCGIYGYPIDEAATVAISTIRDSSNGLKEVLHALLLCCFNPVRKSANGLKEVHFVLFSDDIYDAWLAAANKILKN